LQNLLEISQNEIQELTKSLSDAKKIHQDFMKFLKPLEFLIDFINWIYGKILYKYFETDICDLITFGHLY
jgi:hypothetical protein